MKWLACLWIRCITLMSLARTKTRNEQPTLFAHAVESSFRAGVSGSSVIAKRYFAELLVATTWTQSSVEARTSDCSCPRETPHWFDNSTCPTHNAYFRRVASLHHTPRARRSHSVYPGYRCQTPDSGVNHLDTGTVDTNNDSST
jgi:hypothetical protein